MDNPVVVPHSGMKPAWLEDDAWIIGGVACVRAHAQHMHWRDDNYFLPADHWAAPVLAAGLTPWNPRLQGEGPPKDYAGGRWMTTDGEIWPAGEPMDWKWLGNDCDIIGYEATPSQPASPPHESAAPVGMRQLAEMVDADIARHGMMESFMVRNGFLRDILSFAIASEAATPDLQAENARLRGALEWQPIETAPIDGTWFIAFWPVAAVEDQVRVTQWMNDPWEPCFIDSNQWIDWTQPTHWMPLPEPPARLALSTKGEG